MTRPHFDPAAIFDLDLREVLLAGGEPLPEIQDAAMHLAPGGVLHLRTPFQPTPLLTMLARQGFDHYSESFSPDDWSTWFWRDPLTEAKTGNEPAAAVQDDVMDLRLLPPPEPMLRIIERLERGEGNFDVYLPFYPEPLVPVLRRYGCTLELVMQGSDGVQVRIKRDER